MLRAVLLLICLFPALAPAATFYLDPAGDDGRDGTTPETAWKTIARAQQQKLAPGDALLFRSGETWHESLRINGAGAAGKRITIGSYPALAGFIAPAVIDASGDACIDASTSHLEIRNLVLVHAKNPQRGAIMVWADRDLEDIRITQCAIVASAGRGIWIAGDKGKSVTNVRIENNLFRDNAGSGILVAKLGDASIQGNLFVGNCRAPIDPWQAAIRVWSDDVHDLAITGNTIRQQRWSLKDGAGMGIHIDETGPNVVARDNTIAGCDAAGIEVENTRSVTISNNLISDVHTGIFVYRAGHQHQITRNTVVARDLGIVLQGHRAHGVDAGPEIEVDGQLVTGNVVQQNVALTTKWASLKLAGGAEAGKNTIDRNCFGRERASMFEWGDRSLATVADFEQHAGPTRTLIDDPIRRSSTSGAIQLDSTFAPDVGARRAKE
jgi:parallel beta-helix repeat protein